MYTQSHSNLSSAAYKYSGTVLALCNTHITDRKEYES